MSTNKISTSKLLKHFYTYEAWDDYEHGENGGQINHDGMQCSICLMTYDSVEWKKDQRSEMLKHLFSEHKEEVEEYKKSTTRNAYRHLRINKDGIHQYFDAFRPYGEHELKRVANKYWKNDLPV